MFRELGERWLAARRNIKPVSRDKYQIMLRCQINPWLGERPVRSLTTDHLSDYVWAMHEAGYGPVTVRFAFTTVKAVLDFGVRLGIVDTNQARLLPTRDRPRVGKRNTRPLSPNEIERLLQTAREPYKTIFAIGIFAGLRSGEIRGLKWRDIDLERNRIHVRRQAQLDQLVAPKTTNAFREVSLLDPLPSLLAARRGAAGAAAGDDRLLFTDKGKPLRAARLCYTLRKTAERAGCERAPEDPPLRFHDLRHSSASIMIAAGADLAFVARQLGHASPAITLSTYAHLLDEASNIGRVNSFVSDRFSHEDHGEPGLT